MSCGERRQRLRRFSACGVAARRDRQAQGCPTEPCMQSTVEVRNRRRILCVFPSYSPSFGTFDSIHRFCGVRAFMPPQGILVIAAYLPALWEVRLVDENLRAARQHDFAWADA